MVGNTFLDSTQIRMFATYATESSILHVVFNPIVTKRNPVGLMPNQNYLRIL
jgi:hypothetical protein